MNDGRSQSGHRRQQLICIADHCPPIIACIGAAIDDEISIGRIRLSLSETRQTGRDTEADYAVAGLNNSASDDLIHNSLNFCNGLIFTHSVAPDSDVNFTSISGPG